jgi:hypothetical protein
LQLIYTKFIFKGPYLLFDKRAKKFGKTSKFTVEKRKILAQ